MSLVPEITVDGADSVVRLLEVHDADVQQAACSVVGLIVSGAIRGPDATRIQFEPFEAALVITLLESPHEKVRETAQFTLGRLGFAYVRQFCDAICIGSPSIQQGLCDVLAHVVGPWDEDDDARKVKDLLWSLLDASDWKVRLKAANALCCICPKSNATTVALVKAIVEGRSGKDIERALWTLKGSAVFDTAIVELSRFALSTNVPYQIRFMAWHALQYLDPEKAALVQVTEVDVRWDAEALTLVDDFLFLRTIRAKYSQGATSYRTVATRLRAEFNDNQGSGDRFSTSGISRCVDDLTPFFAKVLGKTGLKLFDGQKGAGALPTDDCQRALAWIDQFMQRYEPGI